MRYILFVICFFLLISCGSYTMEDAIKFEENIKAMYPDGKIKLGDEGCAFWEEHIRFLENNKYGTINEVLYSPRIGSCIYTTTVYDKLGETYMSGKNIVDFFANDFNPSDDIGREDKLLHEGFCFPDDEDNKCGSMIIEFNASLDKLKIKN